MIGWSEMVRLRFLTLNVWSIPWPVSRDIAKRMSAIGRRIGELGIDVAAFQEVWSGEVPTVPRNGEWVCIKEGYAAHVVLEVIYDMSDKRYPGTAIVRVRGKKHDYLEGT